MRPHRDRAIAFDVGDGIERRDRRMARVRLFVGDGDLFGAAGERGLDLVFLAFVPGLAPGLRAQGLRQILTAGQA